MSSELLKWLAISLIAVVLMSTLLLANAIRPEQRSPELFFAQVTPAAAAAASAPLVTQTR